VVDLTKRWTSGGISPTGRSPFGLTQDGRTDFRGAPLADILVSSLTVEAVDFSRANFEHTRFEGCHFKKCIFDRANLTQIAVVGGSFSECYFRHSDLRLAGIGYGGTEVTECVFEKPKIAKASFGNVIFQNCSFQGEDWKGVMFDGSGFWDCKFVGVFRGVAFSGRHPMRLLEDQYGLPRKTGLHDVDLTEAELSLSEARHYCELKFLKLPHSGSLFICDPTKLLELYKNTKFEPEKNEIIRQYIRLYSSTFRYQELVFVSRNDLVYGLDYPLKDKEGNKIGATVFDFLRQELAISI
jgi:uncharacterized protein YjbI with pentapeptide repeats